MKPMLNECETEDFGTVKKTIENQFNRPLEEIFSEFEKRPIASASLAQVHKARLKSGQLVAVKVQHHGIREEMPGDIKVLMILARIGKKLFSDFDYV